jgi:hypothetical protein
MDRTNSSTWLLNLSAKTPLGDTVQRLVCNQSEWRSAEPPLRPQSVIPQQVACCSTEYGCSFIGIFLQDFVGATRPSHFMHASGPWQRFCN